MEGGFDYNSHSFWNAREVLKQESVCYFCSICRDPNIETQPQKMQYLTAFTASYIKQLQKSRAQIQGKMPAHQEAGCIDLCCRKAGRGALHQCSWEQASSEQCYCIAFGTQNAEGYEPEQDCPSPSFADTLQPTQGGSWGYTTFFLNWRESSRSKQGGMGLTCHMDTTRGRPWLAPCFPGPAPWEHTGTAQPAKRRQQQMQLPAIAHSPGFWSGNLLA